jgi:Putative transposase of IS4/5 family (DUF4096)
MAGRKRHTGDVEIGCWAMIQASKLGASNQALKLTDHEWAAIKPILPNKPRGLPRVDDRHTLNGIFWVLRSGALESVEFLQVV